MAAETIAARWKSVPTVAVLNREFDATALAAEVRALLRAPAPGDRGSTAGEPAAGRDGRAGERDAIVPEAGSADRPGTTPASRGSAPAYAAIARTDSSTGWTVLPLLAPGGDPAHTAPAGPGPLPPADTPHLAASPKLAEALRDLPATVLSASLVAVGPTSETEQHHDPKRGLPWGLVRLHIPVITNPAAVMVIDGREYHWDAGRLWFGDFSRPHRARNTGDTARVHLVADCLLCPRLLPLFPAEFREALPDGEILQARPDQPDPPPRRLRFRMPARFRDWSALEPAATDTTVLAEIASGPNGQLLLLDGEPAYGLVHLGDNEFRFTGWSEERTIAVLSDHVSCRVRVGATVRETICLAEPV